MECCVCYEVKPLYDLKVCKHPICIECSNQIRKKMCETNMVVHPFTNNVSVVIPETITNIKCPYCMKSEPTVYDMNDLKQKYPKEYKMWLTIEMNFRGEESKIYIKDKLSLRVGNKKKKVPIYTPIHFSKGDIVNEDDYMSETHEIYNINDIRTYGDTYIYLTNMFGYLNSLQNYDEFKRVKRNYIGFEPILTTR